MIVLWTCLLILIAAAIVFYAGVCVGAELVHRELNRSRSRCRKARR